MRVWRVENEKGLGAYQIVTGKMTEYGDPERVLEGHHRAATVNRPGPTNDSRLYRYLDEDFYFGFQSHEHYLNWFDEELRDVLRPHASLATYYAPLSEVIFGRKQVIFRRDESRLLKRIPM